MSRIDDLAHPARLPLRLALACVLAALLLAAALLAWLAWQFTQIPPPLALALRVLFFAVPLGGAVELGAIAWRRWGMHEYIKAAHVTRLTTAQAQRFPAGLHSLSFHDSSKALPAPAEPLSLSAPDAGPAAVPTFAQLLDAGRIGPGQPLILGFRADTGEALIGSWSKLYSVGVGGMTGSGKSWLCTFLLAQSVAMSSARLIVIDPHAGDPESLSDRLSGLSAAFKRPVAQTHAQIEDALKLAARELANRIAGSPTPHPIILVCDEWTSLLRGKLEELLAHVALDYAEQGRKFGCFAMLAAQGWQIAAAGPVRDRLASHYAMRTRGDQFRYQLGLRGSAPLDTLFLKPAEAYFLSVAGEITKVVIPHMEPRDLARVGAMIDQPAAVAGLPFGLSPATNRVTPAASVAGDRPALVAATTAAGTATEARRAAALFVAEKKSPADIVKELRGVNSKEGTRYQVALSEVLDLIRQGLREGLTNGS